MNEGLKLEIISFIEEEAERIRYGKLFIELNVVDTNIVDMDIDTKRKKKFNYKNN